MPKLADQLTRQQQSYLRDMQRRWRMESNQLYKRMDEAVRTTMVRNPKTVQLALESLADDVDSMLDDMEKYEAAIGGQAIKGMIASVRVTVEKIEATEDMVKALLAKEITASEASQALYLLVQELRDHRKVAEQFMTVREVVNMTTDKLTEAEKPAAQLREVDFKQAVIEAHKGDDYKRLKERLRRQTGDIRFFSLVRFPVVPLTTGLPKAAELEGIVEVDPINLRDRDGRMRTRYLIFRNQLLLAANANWLNEKARKAKWNQEQVANFVQAEMDALVGHTSLISSPGQGTTQRRERLLGHRLMSFAASEDSRVPNTMFFWFTPTRGAARLLTKLRRVRQWSLSLV